MQAIRLSTPSHLTVESVRGSRLRRMKSDDSEGLRSGALARRAGVSSDTLRHYERIGLLPPPERAPNGYRVYPANAANRVLLVQRALAFGFTLEGLARVLRARDGGHPPCREVRRLAGARLEEVESTLADLTALRDALRAVLRDWDARLAGASRGPARALHLLESLPSDATSRPGAASLTSRRFSRRPRKGRS